MVVVDEEGFRALPTSVAVHRAGQALALGDRARCIAHAQRALALAGPGRPPRASRRVRAHRAGVVGDGDVAAAQSGYAESWQHMERAGHIADVLGLAITLGDLHAIQGRLGDAMRTYEEALRLAAEQGGPVLRGTADMYVGMSRRAPRARRPGRRPASPAAEPGAGRAPRRCRRTPIAGGSRWPGSGRPKGTWTARWLCSPRRSGVYAGDFSPDVRPIAAMRARVLDRAGEVGRRSRLGARPGPVGRRRPQLPARVRARHPGQSCSWPGAGASAPSQPSTRPWDCWTRLLHAAEAGGRTGSVIEILVLQALAHQVRGDNSAALSPLVQALTLAEPEGYVRVFVDEGAADGRAAGGGRGARRSRRATSGGSSRPSARPSRIRRPDLVEPRTWSSR